MSTRAFLVAKAERELGRAAKKPREERSKGRTAELVALSGLSGAALAKILASTAIGTGFSAGTKALLRTGRKAPAPRPAYRPMLVDMPPPPRKLIIPPARRHR